MFIVYGKKYLVLHIISGSLAFALIMGRIVWGFVGTRYVRFGAFLKSVDDVKSEFSVFKDGDASHSVGHPAAAGWVMLLLIFCAFCVGVSGVWLFLATDKVAKETFFYLHELFANTLLVIAFIHLQGVALHLLLHKDGIIKGMIDGKRPAYQRDEIGSLNFAQKLVAVIWFACAILTVLLSTWLAIKD